MEAVEDEEGQADAGDDAPGQQAKELGLDALGDDIMVSHAQIRVQKASLPG